VLTLAMILLFIGVVLLMIEILVIPGFGIFGITGLVGLAVGLGIMMSAPGISGAVALLITLSIAILAVVVAILIIRDKRPRALVLSERLSGSASLDLKHLVGVSGVALTPLRPSGTAELEGSRFNVVTEGEFVPKGRGIMVTQVVGQRIVVKEIQN
jgi:membrane-bound serine protease (ClpP class)